MGPKFWQCGHHGAKNSMRQCSSALVIAIRSSKSFSERWMADGAIAFAAAHSGARLNTRTPTSAAMSAKRRLILRVAR